MDDYFGKWYPCPPPRLDGELTEDYTDRLVGDDTHNRSPYDHTRCRFCAIGFHLDCDRHPHSIRDGVCDCPHHAEVAIPPHRELDQRAVQAFSRMWSLPPRTARRVLAHAQVALQSGEVDTEDGVRAVIEGVYESPINGEFANDIVRYLGYRWKDGKLRKR